MIYFHQIFIFRFIPTDLFWFLTFCVQYTVCVFNKVYVFQIFNFIACPG